MEFVLEPINITKDLILNRVSEEKLMEHYLGVPVKKGLFKSPLRRDNFPTMSFYRSNKTGRLIVKDFGSDFCGDFVSVVMEKFRCSYGKALQIIANDFGITSNKHLVKNAPLIEYTNTKFEETPGAIIQVEIKEFEQYELDWWAKFGITEKTLKKFKVFSCKNVFLNGNLFHLYKEKQLVFGYYGGIREGIERWRIYMPGNRKHKFVSNWKSFRLQGAHMLPKSGDAIVITKSLKDVMVLYEFGIPAIAPISENCYLTDAQHNKLINKFNKVVLFYDNDRAGISNLNKFRKAHCELYPCWIDRKYKTKDISDFYKKYGKEKTTELINYAKEKINTEWECRKRKEEEEYAQ